MRWDPTAATYHYAVTCNSCGATVNDPEAPRCPECGSRLIRADDDGTQSSGSPETGPETSTRSGRHRANDKPQSLRALRDAVKPALLPGMWGQVASAAALTLLAVVGVGAVFVGVLKVYEPGFGVGRSVGWVVVRIVIAGLASLGIPIQHGAAEGAVLPLGALVAVGWVAVWAARNIVGKSPVRTTVERAVDGARMGVPFAVMIFVAALLFRIRDSGDVGADPILALLLGCLWGCLFGAIGGVLAHRRAGELLLEAVGEDSGSWMEGLRSAGVMVTVAATLAGAGVMLFVLVKLVSGDLSLSPGDVLALVFLLVMFAPNIVAGTVAFSAGAPVVFIARSFGVGVHSSVTLLGGSDPSWYLFPFLVVPVCACFFGGYMARKRNVDPARSVEVTAIGASGFAIAVGVMSYLGGIGLGRVFLGAGSLLVLRANSFAALLLSFLWGIAGGVAGWKLAERREAAAERSVSP